MTNYNTAVYEKQIRKFCIDNIALLDSQIYMGSMSKAQKKEAFEIIASLRGVMKSQDKIKAIAKHCTIQPRLIVVKMHNGNTRRRIHRYVYGIPQAMKAEGIF